MSTNLPKLSLFALLCALLLASPMPRAAASAQATTVTTNETVTLTTTVINLCNGDPVTLSGSVHVVTHVTTDSNGGTHIKSHQNYENVTGTTALGVITYRGVSSNNHTVECNG